MLTTHRRLARRAIAGTVVALVAGAGLVAAPAQATSLTTDDASLTWGFSTYSHEWGIATTGHVAPVSPQTADGFTTAQGFTLTDGAGTIADDGEGSLAFTGSVTYSPFAGYGDMVPDKSTVTFADFELDVHSSTEGELTAAVSYHKPEGDLAAQRVTVATFDITSLTAGAGTFSLTTAAPDWTGTVPADTYAAGFSDAWPADLVDALQTVVSTPAEQDLSTYFFRTGNTTGNAKKPPLALTASVAPQVSTSVSYAGGTPTIAVTGEHFTAVTNPGDAGVYVGLAPVGGLPDVTTQDGMDAFADSAWVTTAQMAGGSFSVDLAPTADLLDPRATYAVYTWQAHSHSNTTQDTVTPVALSWAKIGSAAKVAPSWAKKPTTKKAGRLKVKVSGGALVATGTVKVVVKGKKVAATRKATLKKGQATIALPKLKKGTWKVAVSYTSADAAHRNAAKTLTLKVR